MKEINVNIIEVTKPNHVLVDESPIVNDRDYCEMVTIRPSVIYEVDGCKCSITADTTEELIPLMEKAVIFNRFMEDYNMKEFSDIGMNAPTVFSPEDGEKYEIKSIRYYIDNAEFIDDNYDAVKDKIIKIAEKMYSVITE